MIILIMTAVFSIAFALKNLIRPGISRELRKNFISRHINYVIFYTICNIFVVISRIRTLYKKGN